MHTLSFAQELSLAVHTWTPPFLMWVVCVVIVSALLIQHKKREAGIFTIALAATMLTVVLAKTFFAVPRPLHSLVEVHSYAFPSGHAASGMVLALMLTWLFSMHTRSRFHVLLVGGSLGTLAVLLGVSRIYIGAHTPLQVIGGFVVGIVVPVCVLWVCSFFKKPTI